MRSCRVEAGERPSRPRRTRWEITPEGGDTSARRNLDNRLRLIEDLLPPLPGLQLLDAGCGGGDYVRALVARGADAYGLEFVEDKLRTARSLPADVAARISFGDIQRTSFESDHFDAVLLNEVLEHVPDDRAALRELHRLLRPGGSLLIFSPNRLHPFETHGVYAKRSGKRISHTTPFVPWLPLAIGQHFFRYWARNYWPAELRSLLRQSGFEPVHRGFLFPTFENISGRQPAWMQPLLPLLRGVSRLAEATPGLRALGASQWILATKGPVGRNRRCQ